MLDKINLQECFKTATAQLVGFSTETLISRLALMGISKGAEVSVYEDMTTTALRMHIDSLMFGGSEREVSSTVTKTESFPISWWDHLKKDIRACLMRQALYKLSAWVHVNTQDIKITTVVKKQNVCPHLGASRNAHLQFVFSDKEWEGSAQEQRVLREIAELLHSVYKSDPYTVARNVEMLCLKYDRAMVNHQRQEGKDEEA